MVAWLLLWAWSSIVLSHLFYRRHVSKNKSTRVNFRMPGSPYTNWAILLVIGVVAVMLAVYGSTRITFYILVSWLGLLTASYYFNSSRRPNKESLNKDAAHFTGEEHA
jgi:AAT family amino acid transporter